jgi:hypothetical protein
MPFNEQSEAPAKSLGKLPAKSSLRQLHFAHFVKAPPPPPAFSNFWSLRSPFNARSYNNKLVGCCTRASQAVAATRMERIEQRRSISIPTDEVLRVYYAMTSRLYGGGDTGAYETDALSEWRKPDLTFRDTSGRPHTIDAFLRINHTDVTEVKRAIAFSGVHGIKACFALPWAWSHADLPASVWDIDADKRALIGDWLPGSWGGHSVYCNDYDSFGPRIVHTWYDGGREVNYGLQKISWRAFLAYADEAYIVVDSLNSWRRQGLLDNKTAGAIVEAVNSVSDQKIISA